MRERAKKLLSEVFLNKHLKEVLDLEGVSPRANFRRSRACPVSMSVCFRAVQFLTCLNGNNTLNFKTFSQCKNTISKTCFFIYNISHRNKSMCVNKTVLVN